MDWCSIDRSSLNHSHKWFSKAKLGVFIHWGLYSVPAYDDPECAQRRRIGNGSEWYLMRLKKTFRVGKSDVLTKAYHEKHYGTKDYYDFMKDFKGKKFDADKWCKKIKSTGAKYIVFTAKHHDGFCLWETKTTDRHVMRTPLKTDVLLELKKSAKKYNLKFGIYFSWMEFGKKITKKFMNNIVKPQLEELKKYEPDLWWFDGDWSVDCKLLESDAFIKEVHKTGAIVNSRLGKESKGGDYNNYSDRFIPDKKQKDVFECCYTIGLSWGYNKEQKSKHYKSSDTLLKVYNKVTSRNGNLLLNIAPDSDGVFDQEEELRLINLGKKIREQDDDSSSSDSD